MKYLLAVVLFLITSSLYAQRQDTISIGHKYYTTTFDTVKHYPVVVKYWLRKAMYKCKMKVDRKNYKFAPDPLLSGPTTLKKDYLNSHYDKGHNIPAEDNTCNSTGMKECFYYSNMCPQIHKFNAGIWKTLETYTRNKAKTNDSVLVWCGSVSTTGQMIGRIAVPDYCWKILYIKGNNSVEAYSFKNDSSPSQPLASYSVSVDSIYSLTGVRFVK